MTRLTGCAVFMLHTCHNSALSLQSRPHRASHQTSKKHPNHQPAHKTQCLLSQAFQLPQGPSLGIAFRTQEWHHIHGRKRVWSVKASLKHVRRDYARKRTKEAAVFISDFCERQKEDKLELLYFLLCDNLNECGASRYKEVLASWNKETIKLTAEDCLAMRVTTKTSKMHYEAQYKKFKAKGSFMLYK